jgi:hypothetical protein
VAGLDIGELAPGHKLTMRGLCLDRSRRLWLHYTWIPGLSQPQGEDSGVWLNVAYGADVPAGTNCEGSYDTSGGPRSDGEIGYENLPPQARHVWFDFFTTSDDEHRVIRVTVDLATGTVQTQK